MPDIDGRRKILNLYTKGVFDIECTDTVNTNERITSVGKFSFYTAAFVKANLIISSALKQKPDWLVIDEAGKLELDGKGFYPAIKESVEFYSNIGISGNLLITVRDSLCTDVIEFFKLKDYKVIHSLEDIS
jgi:nucleoside-triphosphatase THEP1